MFGQIHPLWWVGQLLGQDNPKRIQVKLIKRWIRNSELININGWLASWRRSSVGLIGIIGRWAKHWSSGRCLGYVCTVWCGTLSGNPDVVQQIDLRFGTRWGNSYPRRGGWDGHSCTFWTTLIYWSTSVSSWMSTPTCPKSAIVSGTGICFWMMGSISSSLALQEWTDHTEPEGGDSTDRERGRKGRLMEWLWAVDEDVMDCGVGFISSAFLPLLLGNGGKAVMVPFFAERALKQQPLIVGNMYCIPVQNQGS